MVKPKFYGGINLGNDEVAAISLNPKFTTYEKIDVTECEAEIEKCLTSIRWNRKDLKRRDNNIIENSGAIRDHYDYINNELDFRKAKSTDLPFNIKTYIPEPLDVNEEICLQALKQELLDTTKTYCKNNKIVMSNLNASERNGVNSLLKKSRNRECVLFQTDKTGIMSVDTVDNYIKSAEMHVKDDKMIDKEKYGIFEKEINAHSNFWVTMFNIGKQFNDQDRFRSSMLSHNSGYSKLYFLRKDHKPYTDEIIGPPSRPVCDVNDTASYRLSYLVCLILREVTSQSVTECISTEDMQASIDEINEYDEINGDTVIGSMDVKSLYPSLDIQLVIDVVGEEFDRSDIKIEGVEYDEVGLYISLNKNSEYIDRVNLSEYCPKRKRRRRKPMMTGSGSAKNKEKRFEPWLPAEKKPNIFVAKIMIKEALKIVLHLIMDNHMYHFNNVLRKQVKGGAIGLDLTEVIARIFMSWWDRELLKRLTNLGCKIHLYKRYVDDINIIMQKIDPGTKYENEFFINCDTIIDEGEVKEDDKRTMLLVKEIGDNISNSISLEIDYPSNNNDRKIPILDMKVWIEFFEQENRYYILYEHYIKEVSSRQVIDYRAALSINDKRRILTQQCLKVFLNCSTKLPWARVATHGSYFSSRLQISGYNAQLRYEIVRSAHKAYENIKKQAEDGIRPVHRKREWSNIQRRENKKILRKNWYKKQGHESFVFVPATPQSQLAKQFREKIKISNIRIKVIEKSGKKIKDILQRNDPLSENKCIDECCLICKTSTRGGCRSSGVTYRIKCENETECPFAYEGQTGKNGYSRGNEHMFDYESKNKNSVLWKHCQLKHENVEQNFSMDIIDRCRGDPTKRQILEAVHINNKDALTSMNDRSEWNFVNIPRIQITN